MLKIEIQDLGGENIVDLFLSNKSKNIFFSQATLPKNKHNPGWK